MGCLPQTETQVKMHLDRMQRLCSLWPRISAALDKSKTTKHSGEKICQLKKYMRIKIISSKFRLYGLDPRGSPWEAFSESNHRDTE